jgi:hypothetical protein
MADSSAGVLTFRIDDQTWELDMDELTNRDVMALEDVTGLPIDEWGKRLQGGSPSMRDITLMVWLARRHAGERNLAFDDVEFRMGHFSIESDEDEAQAEDGRPRPTATPDDPGTAVSAPIDSPPSDADTWQTLATTSAYDPGNGAV